MCAKIKSRDKKRIKETLFYEQDGICAYCKEEMVLHNGPYGQPTLNTITIEHSVPRSRGGTNKQINLLGVCYKCNHERGNGKEGSSVGAFRLNQKKLDTYSVFTCFPGTYVRYNRPLVWQINKGILELIV